MHTEWEAFRHTFIAQIKCFGSNELGIATQLDQLWKDTFFRRERLIESWNRQRLALEETIPYKEEAASLAWNRNAMLACEREQRRWMLAEDRLLQMNRRRMLAA